jgi:hypothetical protein
MTDKAEALLEMYKVQVHRSEHYENQRAVVTNVIITLSAALVALATFDNNLSRADCWNGFFIILLGFFGWIASRLHGARSRRHGQRAAEYRKELDKELPDAGINEVRDRVQKKSTHLNRVWEWLHLAIIIIGALLSILAWYSQK